MLPISSLLDKLRADFPGLNFIPDEEFRWSPLDKSIFYDPEGEAAFLLHEVAHALLGHTRYTRDVTLLEMEREAWEHAHKTLFPRYDLLFSSDIAEDALDSYRDWLHSRSTCPECQSTGVQTRTDRYRCLACHTHWRVNEARACGLRRYVISQKHP